MKMNNKIVEIAKFNITDYLSQIAVFCAFIVLALIYSSFENGKYESFFTLMTVLIIILLIPLNQIFRIKRIHIYKIEISDTTTIFYQDILRSKTLKINSNDLRAEIKETSIDRCYKLIISTQDTRLTQYCNKYWTNQKLKEVGEELNLLRSQNVE